MNHITNITITKVAILVDGGFYRENAKRLFGKKGGKESAQELVNYCNYHIQDSRDKDKKFLYKVFYYDCSPEKATIIHPLSKDLIDLSRTSQYIWMNEFIYELTHQRKFCLRMGRLAVEQAKYVFHPQVVERLCNKEITVDDLKKNDFKLDVKQKGVDMQIGIDIASLAYKKTS